MNIDYNKVRKLHSFHGVVLKGNETFDELLEIEKDRKKRIEYLMNRIDNLNHTNIKLDILLNVFEHLTEEQLDTIEARTTEEAQQDDKENNPIETDEERRERIKQDNANIQRVDNQIKR
jgi:hypothetical protein